VDELGRVRPELPRYIADNIDHQGVLEAGIEFLPKPFTPTALVTKVRDSSLLSGEGELAIEPDRWARAQRSGSSSVRTRLASWAGANGF
jgi:hypothetical protein